MKIGVKARGFLCTNYTFKLNIYLCISHDPAIPLQGIYLKKWKHYVCFFNVNADF